MDGLDRIKKNCRFENEYNCFVLLAVARKKYNDLTNSNEVVFREVIKEPKDITRKYNRIKALATNYISPEGNRYNFYIYLSVNPRNALKASFSLLKRINDWNFEALNGVDISKRLKKIDNIWISELMKPENKSGRGRFLVDVDTKDGEKLNDILNKISKLVTNYQYYDTRNGTHILTDPFNPTDFKFQDAEVKKDALLFIEFVDPYNMGIDFAKDIDFSIIGD